MSIDEWMAYFRSLDFVDDLSSKSGPRESLLDLEIRLSSGELASLWLRTEEPVGALVMFRRYAFENVSARELADLLRALARGEFQETHTGRRWRIDTIQPRLSAISRG